MANDKQNINSESFLKEFDLKKMTVGQLGYGYIGQAVEALFKDHCKVLINDKFKPGTDSLADVVLNSQVIFVAVPTPMKASGECHTEIVESVLQDVQTEAVKVGRDLDDFIVVIKSTVPPGFTKRMQNKFALRILFSPEFLTEANSVKDFKTAKRVILGGDLDDARVVYKFFEGVWPDRIVENYVDNPFGPVSIISCDSEVAEMVKLFTNGLLMTRVLFANEMYQVCNKLGINYDEVRLLSCFDPRINPSHLLVPGPDGHLGAGGHCFPKDMNSLKFLCSQLGINEKLFTAVLERNNELRDKKDWEEMKGRAVVDG